MWTWCTPQDVAAHPTCNMISPMGCTTSTSNCLTGYLNLPHSNPCRCVARDVPRGTYGTEEGGSPGGGRQHLVPLHVAESLGKPFRDFLVPELAACAASGLSVPLATNCFVPLPTMLLFPCVPLPFCPKWFQLSGLSIDRSTTPWSNSPVSSNLLPSISHCPSISSMGHCPIISHHPYMFSTTPFPLCPYTSHNLYVPLSVHSLRIPTSS